MILDTLKSKAWMLAACAAGALLAAQTVRLYATRADLATATTTLAGVRQAHAETLTDIANLATKAAQESAALLQHQGALVAAIDQKSKEKDDALRQNEALRRDVAAGTRRVRVAGTCITAGGRDLPQAAAAPGLDPAPTVELTAAAGQGVFDIRAGIIADQHALTALQEYVATVCPGPAP
nr:lysis system i-spanin subunit Rz [uncultured Albidiferax sp.]